VHSFLLFMTISSGLALAEPHVAESVPKVVNGLVAMLSMFSTALEQMPAYSAMTIIHRGTSFAVVKLLGASDAPESSHSRLSCSGIGSNDHPRSAVLGRQEQIGYEFIQLKTSTKSGHRSGRGRMAERLWRYVIP
jgi:hypothetical protein